MAAASPVVMPAEKDPTLPVAAIVLPPPQQDRRGADSKLDTPAELPPGRVSFGDELGRETALRACSQCPDARARDELARRDGDQEGESQAQQDDATALALAASAHQATIAAKEPHAPPNAGESLRATVAVDPGSEGIDVHIDRLDVEALLAIAEGDGAHDGDASGSPSLVPSADELANVGGDLAADAPSLDVVEAADFVELTDLADPAGLAGEASAAPPVAETSGNAGTITKAAATLVAPPETNGVELAAALERTLATSRTMAPARAPEVAASAALDATTARIERLVALSDLPRALAAEVDGFLRLRGRGSHWEAELRLDPPELGALHLRLELRGEALHGVVRAEDPRLESRLDGLLHDLEQELRRPGEEAAFDLRRGTREDLEARSRLGRADRTAIRGEEPARAVRREGIGARSDRLVDLLA